MNRLRAFKLKYRFSDIELQHLSIGTLLFTAVMVSLFFGRYLRNPTTENLIFMFGLALFTAPLFFLHEIGHKVSAQHYNMWAEFRLDQQGAMLTALSIILPFKFVGPGAVMIRATSFDEIPKMGKISAYGPTVNIFLGGVYLIATGLFLALSYFVSSTFLVMYDIFFYASGFSYFLAIFNMLPFGPLDGKKVKFWNNNAFWLFFTISGIFALETFIYGIMFSGGFVFLIAGTYHAFGYLLGGFLFSYIPLVTFLMFYPIMLGSISLIIGFTLLQKLKDPFWVPGASNEDLINKSGYTADYVQSYFQTKPKVDIKRNVSKEKTPMNQPCAECGKKELLPFKCSTCKKLYCAEHRLPGRHFCVIDAKEI